MERQLQSMKVELTKTISEKDEIAKTLQIIATKKAELKRKN